MARVVHVEERLGQPDLAAPGLFERDERQRVVQNERDVPGQLVLASVLVQVRHIHSLQVQVEPFAGQQPLLQAVPVAELDEV